MEWRELCVTRPIAVVQRDFHEVSKNWAEFPGNDDPSRKGCVGTVLDDETGDLAMPQEYVGDIPVGKLALYAFYSLEKGIRLGEHHRHLTSAASALTLEENAKRGATDKKYPGATRARGFLRFSHSGYTGIGDQCCSAAMQDRAGLLNDAMLEQIERESGSKLTRAFVLFDRQHRP